MAMNIGLGLALVSAVCFAAAQVVNRKGLYHTNTALGTIFITVPLGMIYFAILIFTTGQYKALLYLPGHVYLLLGLIGIINFIGGRLLNYTGVQLLGANRNSTLVRTSPLWSVTMGILILGETINLIDIFGIIMVIGGAALVSFKREKQEQAMHVKGVIAGLGGALLYATGAVLIRVAVGELDSIIAAVFVSFIVPTIVLGCLLSGEYFRRQLFQLKRSALIPFLIGGTLSAAAQYFRFSALDYVQVSIVEPVMSINAILILVFSYFFNRRIEIFSLRVIVAIMLSAIGVAMIFM
ncbi:DMT family transporter [Chloroflexota bacterium]